jgi:hypothetical protein
MGIIVIQVKVNSSIIPLNQLCVDDHGTNNYSYLRDAAIQIDVHPTRET